MIDEKRLAELRQIVFGNRPSPNPVPNQWELFEELFGAFEAALKVVRAAQLCIELDGGFQNAENLKDALAPFTEEEK